MVFGSSHKKKKKKKKKKNVAKFSGSVPMEVTEIEPSH